MSHCLAKMFGAIAESGYDFWYYQSLLETPYVTLNQYVEQYSLRAEKARELEALEAIQEELTPKHKKGGMGASCS